MKNFVRAFALFLLSACGFVQDELYQSGGFVGARANSFLPAQTPQQRFDRYMIIAMILAPAALETAVDEEEAAATIRRVNAMYASLAELRRSLYCGDGVGSMNNVPVPPGGYAVVCDSQQTDDPAEAWGDIGDELRSNGYQFEQLENAVQQDLFFVARSVVVNLELNTEAEDLLRLNAWTLARLWRKVEDLLPMFRETAARFRGGVILYADISQATCDTERAECLRLQGFMRQKFRGLAREDGFVPDPNLPERDVQRMLELAKRVFDGSQWRLSDPQYIAIIQQIDQSCEVAYHRQLGPEAAANAGSNPHCGFGIRAPDGVAWKQAPSEARSDLIRALRDSPFPEPVLATPIPGENSSDAELTGNEPGSPKQ
ncbi:hypothetical protein [Octadecabacter ascidiaceicola]|nr:hypothetical protein [Octadecabacter ascidiaceicola]